MLALFTRGAAAWLAVSLVACDAGVEDAGGSTSSESDAGGNGAGASGGSSGSFPTGGSGTGAGGAAMECPGDQPPILAGPEVSLAPEYAGLYTTYELGVVPGMPAGPLGGVVVKHDDPNTLLIAGNSEQPTGGIYSIQVERGPCGHIIGFVGSATLVAPAPYVDANLVYGPSNVLFYTEWPVNQLSQLLPNAAMAAATLDASSIGVVGAFPNSSVSGFGFVPPPLANAGAPRTVVWPDGDWYQLTISGAGPTFDLSSGTKITTLPGGPGGFAYVPAGSPGFDAQSLIVAEWSGSPNDKVGTYEVDAAGDPIVSTRKDFFSVFPKPWGAYFEPVTGDYLFLTWGDPPDRMYIVQGFAPPPPPPPPPQ